ncbi:HEAT repeat domain-containing protein [Nostoc ellipsosporum NOK]|nr:HEAT repeat domain-containing protein [Nostoc ellipsosporum NOK]
MIFEWFTTWVATKAVGFLVKTIISEDFVKDLVKDYAKDFFKYIFNNAVTAPFKREPLDKAVVMALTEFLQLMQDDLEYVGLSEDDIKKYTQPIKQFLKHQEVKVILGNAFKHDCQAIDTKKLQAIWYQLNSSSALSDDFNWQVIGKKYLKKVQDIIREVPELRDILDSWNLETIKQNTTEIAGIIPQFDLERYQEGIRERYGKLKLESLDTTGYAYNDLKLWRMFIAQNVRKVHQVLPQVHELPKEHLRRLRETNQLEAEVALEELERQKRVYFEQPICSVLDVVNDQHYKYVVILGDPGSGKSTLLQYLALNWAESPLNNPISLPIPVLIELRTYMRRRINHECQNFLEFYHQCSGVIAHLNQHQLHEQLKAGNALVMFDGLDEVFDPGQREDVITDIHRFTNDYPNVQVIVTSRVIGYKPQRLLDADFRHFMLQDLDSEQIQDFISRWHELTFSDEADKLRKRERLKRGIANSKAITELAGNPLLLTMMAILNRNQELPRDRATLYDQASRVLLHQWDVERALVEDKRLDPKTIDYKDKQAMLRQVAYFMQTGEKGLAGNLIHADNLEKILTDYLKTIEFDKPREAARVMINQLRTRNFMLCFMGADYYAFVHRTFLEYFCAWEFVWQFKETQTLSIEGLKQDVFGKHWQDETWHEVLQLIAGMIEPRFVGEIIDCLMVLDGEEEKFVNLFLAAKCLAEVRNRPVIESTANKLLDKLKDLTKYDFWYYYDFLFVTKETELVKEIRTQAIAAIVTTWQESLNTKTFLQTRALDDGSEYVRGAAIQALASNYKDDAQTKTILQTRALDDGSEYVRGAAIEALASNYKDDSQTKTILQTCALDDGSEYVRGAAIAALASNYKDDSQTKTFLQSRALDDESWDVRGAAISALASNYKDDSQTKTFLQSRALDDKDGGVRYAAIQAIASNYKEDSQTKTILQTRALDDKNWDVRRAAIQAIASNYKDDSQTKTILQTRALDDKDGGVRYAAIQAIASNYKDDSQTKTILQSRALDDKSWDVRRAAIQALGKHFKYQPDLFDTYYHCAINDPFERKQSRQTNPRRVAVEIIIKQFPQHSQTLPLLRDRAENDPDEQVREYAQNQLKQWRNS